MKTEAICAYRTKKTCSNERYRQNSANNEEWTGYPLASGELSCLKTLNTPQINIFLTNKKYQQQYLTTCLQNK